MHKTIKFLTVGCLLITLFCSHTRACSRPSPELYITSGDRVLVKKLVSDIELSILLHGEQVRPAIIDKLRKKFSEKKQVLVSMGPSFDHQRGHFFQGDRLGRMYEEIIRTIQYNSGEAKPLASSSLRKLTGFVYTRGNKTESSPNYSFIQHENARPFKNVYLLSGLDGYSFENLGGCYAREKSGIYRLGTGCIYAGHPSGPDDIYTIIPKKTSIDPNTVQIRSEGLATDKDFVYRDGKVLEYPGGQQARAKDFRFLSNLIFESPSAQISSYLFLGTRRNRPFFFSGAKDIHNLQPHDKLTRTDQYSGYTYLGSKVVAITGSDGPTLELVGTDMGGPDYYKDKYNVYYNYEVISGADSATFMLFGGPDAEGNKDTTCGNMIDYSKDKDHVFYEGKVVTNASPEGFCIAKTGDPSPCYARQGNFCFVGDQAYRFYHTIKTDENYVYGSQWSSQYIITGADPKTFVLLSTGLLAYAMDKNNVFYYNYQGDDQRNEWHVISGVDKKTFNKSWENRNRPAGTYENIRYDTGAIYYFGNKYLGNHNELKTTKRFFYDAKYVYYRVPNLAGETFLLMLLSGADGVSFQPDEAYPKDKNHTYRCQFDKRPEGWTGCRDIHIDPSKFTLTPGDQRCDGIIGTGCIKDGQLLP